MSARKTQTLKSRKKSPGLSASITQLLNPSFIFFAIMMIMSFYVGKVTPPTWTVENIALQVRVEESTNKPYYIFKKKKKYINIIDYQNATLKPNRIKYLNATGIAPTVKEEFVLKTTEGKQEIFQLKATKHWGFWSLLPALTAIGLCWLTKQPIAALLGGIFSGALLLGLYDMTELVFIPKFATTGAAGILLLYLFLLGGLMGIWSRTGAAQAFAEFMTKHFVRGPKTAKLVAWLLGIIFFQGGTVSTVLVGTTVKPLADKEKISHEELSYIVDSTASPIASILAFNAWPGYVQAFIYVSGVSWLATEADRVAFFFSNIKYSFYCLFAVILTLLLSLDKAPFLGKRMKAAIKRSREKGQLNHPDSDPLSSEELAVDSQPEGYTPNVLEFFIPLFVLIGIAIGTYMTGGSPQVRLAFGASLLTAISMALFRGMSLKDVIIGVETGLKGVVVGAVILLLAITIGGLSKETGGGIFLVELLGSSIPYWLLPVILQALTMLIAFSTGTSWGTYAVAFPLAMPLAFAIGNAQVENLPLFIGVCFATVLNGSVYGDQCSPISDTTGLSAMCTGSDLMDHVKTQIVPASFAAGLAGICWTLTVLLFA